MGEDGNDYQVFLDGEPVSMEPVELPPLDTGGTIAGKGQLGWLSGAVDPPELIIPIKRIRYGRISRKRYIKLLMGKGCSKREAELRAAEVRRVGWSYTKVLNHPVCFAFECAMLQIAKMVGVPVQILSGKEVGGL